MTPASSAARYFDAIAAALGGLDIFLRDDRSPLYRHDLVARVVSEYVVRLENSFACWKNRLGFTKSFRIQRAESGYPVFQTVLELENDRRTAQKRLAAIPEPDTLRAEMADFILRNKAFPHALQASMAERLYLEEVGTGLIFSPFVLPRTIRLSVNPNTMRPVYVTHWGAFDGVANLPMIYMGTIEDSSDRMVSTIVGADGKVRDGLGIDFPVDGLLNPDLAHGFDAFAEKNSAYSLSPATIAGNLDKDFATLHPKQLRRIVLGPFYSAGVTEHNATVSGILEKVRRAENAWLLTWTVQEVYSKGVIPGRKGLWSKEPDREELFIDTADFEAARMGVSAYERHALIPHEAYQLLYASGEAKGIFAGYKVHIVSNGKVISDV
ncbi:MAG: hypothetical protein K5872_16040 [Rhizobiaceae bacterium]|nr:hypothetical protein [Rhizobiaceae bacterium]MCV0407734.1 hypothetical protein [Rhizobiaceae bacterium]